VKMRVTKAVRAGRRAVLVMAMAATVTAPVFAQQTVEDSQAPAANLDLPQNLQIFGKVDPNIRKPTAIVNDVVITGTDVDQRVNLVVALNGYKLQPEELDKLKLGILRQLIDETLEIQEAKAHDVTVDQTQIDNAFARVSRNFNKSPDEMRTFLRQNGSSERSIRRQIEGEMAWQRLLARRVQVNISDEEVQAVIKRMEDAKGSEEYHISEIYMSAVTNRDQVYAGMQGLIDQMRKGTPFGYLARTYSEATTKATDGDLGWIQAGMLPTELSDAVTHMQVGQVAGPIEIPGGYSILFLQDRRTVLGADPRDAKLSLRQLTLKFPAGTTKTQAETMAANFAKTTSAIKGCGDVANAAKTLNAEVVDNDSVRIRDLPAALADIILKMQIGEATPPFGSAEDGIRSLVLCGRDDPKVASVPSAEAISQQLENERVNLRANRMLRDLRRDALIEYR